MLYLNVFYYYIYIIRTLVGDTVVILPVHSVIGKKEHGPLMLSTPKFESQLYPLLALCP